MMFVSFQISARSYPDSLRLEHHSETFAILARCIKSRRDFNEIWETHKHDSELSVKMLHGMLPNKIEIICFAVFVPGICLSYISCCLYLSRLIPKLYSQSFNYRIKLNEW